MLKLMLTLMLILMTTTVTTNQKQILGRSNELTEEDIPLDKLPSSFHSRKIIQNRVNTQSSLIFYNKQHIFRVLRGLKIRRQTQFKLVAERRVKRNKFHLTKRTEQHGVKEITYENSPSRMQKIQLIPSKFRHCALITVVCNFCRRINTSLNSTTETYCSVALVSFQGHFISLKHQNEAQDAPCTKIIDDTTGKYCSVAFI